MAQRVHVTVAMLQDQTGQRCSRSVFGRDPRRLVIADDSADVRWTVRRAIGDRFADVVEVSDGRALLWTLLRASFAASAGTAPELVVVTDLGISAYDGLAVLGAWRDAAPKVPLIVMTAEPSAAIYARAGELGAFVLAKPFAIAALRSVVEHAVADRPEV